jgi:hypothetical protein
VHSTFDRAWFVLGAALALFVVLGPDRFIRIVSYGRARITDAPVLMKALRVIAAVVVISTLIALAWDAWSAS